MMDQKQIKDKCKYLQCTIPVYYFDEFNFEKEYTESNFPCRTTNGAWQVTIDIKSHKILEWKDGFGKLHLFSKVVDEGTYSLLDENKQEFYRIEGYVPNHILPETDGFGDYLTLEIDADGTITNWYKNISFKDFVDNGFSTILPTDINNIKNFFMKFLLPSMQKLDLEFDKLTKGLFYESGVYFDLNSRNFDGFYVNSDYAKLQFNNDLDKKAQLISVFYLRYQGRAPISRFQNIKVVNLYSVVKICENGFKVNALHKTFDFDTNFADENLQNKLICKFVDIFKQALNSGKAYGSYEV